MRAPIVATVLVAAALVAAALLAGCGSSGPSTSEFKSGFQADRTQFRQLGVALQRTVSSARHKTNARLAAEFTKLSKRASRQVERLAELDAPSQYKPTLDRLLTGFRAVTADLKQIATTAADNDPHAASVATRSLLSSAAQVKAADMALSDALGLSR
jgi:hypothetical protein